MNIRIKWLQKENNLAVLIILRNKRRARPIFFRAYSEEQYIKTTRNYEEDVRCSDCCVQKICCGNSLLPKYQGVNGITYFCCNIFELDRSWISYNKITRIYPVKTYEWKKLRNNYNSKKEILV